MTAPSVQRSRRPAVAAIVVTWNKKPQVLRCLESIQRQRHPDLTVFVVDNASTDGTAEAVRDRFPRVRLLRLPENVGGSGGFRHGLQVASADDRFSFFHLMDNDIVVDGQATAALVRSLETHRWGAVGSLILRMDEPAVIQEAGGRLDWRDTSFQLVLAGRDENEATEPIRVDYVPACSMMVPRESLDRAGLVDGSYFLYWDDIEWCLRIRKQGRPIAAEPCSKVWHEGGGRRKRSAVPTYYYWRNRFRMLLHHCPAPRVRDALDRLLDDWGRARAVTRLRGDAPTEQALALALRDVTGRRFGRFGGTLGAPREKKLPGALESAERLGLVAWSRDPALLETIRRRLPRPRVFELAPREIPGTFDGCDGVIVACDHVLEAEPPVPPGRAARIYLWDRWDNCFPCDADLARTRADYMRWRAEEKPRTAATLLEAYARA